MTEKIPASYWSTDAVITEHDWAALEAAGCVDLCGEVRQSVQSAIDRYRDANSRYRESPRASEVKSFLTEIAAKGKEFTAILGKLPDGIAEAVQDRIDFIAWRFRRDLYLISDVRGAVARLVTDAATALVTDVAVAGIGPLQSDLGREGDPYLDKLLDELLVAYHTAGGKGRYTERAFEFLRRAVALADVKLHSREATKKRLQRGQKSTK